jgi:hypothetical protein
MCGLKGDHVFNLNYGEHHCGLQPTWLANYCIGQKKCKPSSWTSNVQIASPI